MRHSRSTEFGYADLFSGHGDARFYPSRPSQHGVQRDDVQKVNKGFAPVREERSARHGNQIVLVDAFDDALTTGILAVQNTDQIALLNVQTLGIVDRGENVLLLGLDGRELAEMVRDIEKREIAIRESRPLLLTRLSFQSKLRVLSQIHNVVARTKCFGCFSAYLCILLISPLLSILRISTKLSRTFCHPTFPQRTLFGTKN